MTSSHRAAGATRDETLHTIDVTYNSCANIKAAMQK